MFRPRDGGGRFISKAAFQNRQIQSMRPRDSAGRFISSDNGLSAFANRMRRRARDLETDANSHTVQLAALIHQYLVLGTPVDTGHARANWQVGIDNEPEDELDDFDTGGGGTISKAVTVLQERQPGQVIHIANNVPYIQRLNEGWSAQAPAGFVEIAINTAINQFRNSKVLR